MATDSFGLAHVLWDGTGSTYTHQAFYTAETGDGSWLPAVDLSQYITHINGADMVIDSHGTAHIVWSADGVYYRNRPAGGTWSPKELIASSRYGGVSLFADALDRIHLAWGDDSHLRVHYAVRSNGVWSSPAGVAPSTTIPSQSSPNLVVDENHRVHVIWIQYQNLNNWTIRYSAQNPLGQWSSPVDVFQNDHGTEADRSSW